MGFLLIVEHEEVRRNEPRPEMAQRRGDLTAVITRVVHEVVHQPPEGVPQKAFGRHRLKEGSLLDLDF